MSVRSATILASVGTLALYLLQSERVHPNDDPIATSSRSNSDGLANELESPGRRSGGPKAEPESATQRERSRLETLDLDDLDRWHEITRSGLSPRAEWNLKDDLIAEMSQRLSIHETISFILDNSGHGAIRTNLIGTAFGYSNEDHEELIRMMEKLPFSEERKRAGDAIWNDQNALPESFVGIRNLSKEGQLSLAASMSLSLNSSADGSDRYAYLEELWGNLNDNKQTSTEAAKVFVNGIKERFPDHANEFKERFFPQKSN